MDSSYIRLRAGRIWKETGPFLWPLLWLPCFSVSCPSI